MSSRTASVVLVGSATSVAPASCKLHKRRRLAAESEKPRGAQRVRLSGGPASGEVQRQPSVRLALQCLRHVRLFKFLTIIV